MSILCLVVGVIFLVLAGFKVEPEALKSISIPWFGVAFFAASFLPWARLNRSE